MAVEVIRITRGILLGAENLVALPALAKPSIIAPRRVQVQKVGTEAQGTGMGLSQVRYGGVSPSTSFLAGAGFRENGSVQVHLEGRSCLRRD